MEERNANSLNSTSEIYSICIKIFLGLNFFQVGFEKLYTVLFLKRQEVIFTIIHPVARSFDLVWMSINTVSINILHKFIYKYLKKTSIECNEMPFLGKPYLASSVVEFLHLPCKRRPCRGVLGYTNVVQKLQSDFSKPWEPQAKALGPSPHPCPPLRKGRWSPRKD